MRREELELLHRTIRECTGCPLQLSRRHAVPGEGPCDAGIFLIGEAPGAKEDETGRPFAGRAGKVLDGLLGGAGIARERVFITSILKCRPPANREPAKEEVIACLPYLWRQLNLIRPMLVLPMGRHAVAHTFPLFGMEARRIGEVHGSIFDCIAPWGRVRVIPVYHPAAATHNPGMREVLGSDFSLLRDFRESRAMESIEPVE
ncbi:MAG: uracil-DNA glycosylase [Methanomicrobiales archaeon]|nr:uracil-DNA glycosylase [Methanomicrobiales archaeon]